MLPSGRQGLQGTDELGSSPEQALLSCTRPVLLLTVWVTKGPLPASPAPSKPDRCLLAHSFLHPHFLCCPHLPKPPATADPPTWGLEVWCRGTGNVPHLGTHESSSGLEGMAKSMGRGQHGQDCFGVHISCCRPPPCHYPFCLCGPIPHWSLHPPQGLNSMFEVYLVGNNSHHFIISPTSVQGKADIRIRVAIPLDYETVDRYDFDVRLLLCPKPGGRGWDSWMVVQLPFSLRCPF